MIDFNQIPHPDQMIISVPSSNKNAYDMIISYFESCYGKKRRKKDEDEDEIYPYPGYFFQKSGIFVSDLNIHCWFSIIFTANEKRYNSIISLLKMLKRKRLIINRRGLNPCIRKIEIAYDFHFGVNDYKFYEWVQDCLNQCLIPVTKMSLYSNIFTSKKPILKPDGAQNGLITWYWRIVARRSLDLQFPQTSRCSSLKFKNYCKLDNSLRFLRFEVTANRSWIKKHLGMRLPNTYNVLIKRLETLPFDTFWQFTEVDLHTFVEAYNNHAIIKHLSPLGDKEIEDLAKEANGDKIYSMRKLAKSIGANRLLSTLNNYISKYSGKEAHDKTVDFLIDNLMNGDPVKHPILRNKGQGNVWISVTG